jgi:hypothetical protein
MFLLVHFRDVSVRRMRYVVCSEILFVQSAKNFALERRAGIGLQIVASGLCW